MVELEGVIAVSIVNEFIEVVELYIFRAAALILPGDSVTFGAIPKALLKVIVAIVPVTEQPPIFIKTETVAEP